MEPYEGGSGNHFRVDHVKVLEENEQERQKNLIQREKERADAALRAKALEEELSRVETFFGSQVTLRLLVPKLGQPGHCRQQDFWANVDLQFRIGAVYDMVCDKSFPSSECMDGTVYDMVCDKSFPSSECMDGTTLVDAYQDSSSGQGERNSWTLLARNKHKGASSIE